MPRQVARISATIASGSADSGRSIGDRRSRCRASRASRHRAGRIATWATLRRLVDPPISGRGERTSTRDASGSSAPRPAAIAGSAASGRAVEAVIGHDPGASRARGHGSASRASTFARTGDQAILERAVGSRVPAGPGSSRRSRSRASPRPVGERLRLVGRAGPSSARNLAAVEVGQEVGDRPPGQRVDDRRGDLGERGEDEPAEGEPGVGELQVAGVEELSPKIRRSRSSVRSPQRTVRTRPARSSIAGGRRAARGGPRVVSAAPPR